MACETLGVNYIRGYVHPFWGVFRIGWVMVNTPDPSFLYCDNAPTISMYSSNNLRYVTIGFTERGVLRRLKKYVESIYCS